MNEKRSCCDAEDGPDIFRDAVRQFYSKAAVTSQERLCCPTEYNSGDLSHIPEEVLEISYGCGSPVNRANILRGESVVDLGSGGGIDCFIAAKLVGETGRVYGIDMTEEMLNVARTNGKKVAENLSYSNVEFKHGFLENIPMEDGSVHLVTSNCVVNLSTDKKEVFKEIHRILKPEGRFVIADIISEKAVPADMKNNKELWGECISGALTLKEFLDAASLSGFHGLSVRKDYLWKEVNGIKFYSFTIEGYKYLKPENTSCCKTFTAIYAGPFNSVTCQNTQFPVGVPVEIDEEMAVLLQSHPYADLLSITDPETEAPAESESDSCCG